MRVRAVLLAGLTAALIAACSPPASQGPESADNAGGAGAPAGMGQMQPGQYRTTVTMLEMNMPGVPAGAMAQMQGTPITTEYCVTAGDVAEVSMRDLRNGANGMECTDIRTNSSGGRIDNQATCTTPVGTMTMHMVGTYTDTRTEIETTSTTQMAQGEMTQRSQMVSERIGDCPAAEAAAP